MKPDTVKIPTARRAEPGVAASGGPSANGGAEAQSLGPVVHHSILGRVLVWGIVVLAVIAVGWLVVVRIKQGPAPVTTGRGSRNAPAPPVVVQQAWVGDLPIYLDNPGTVTPLNTVTVRSRVDGQLIKVAFKEAEIVKENQVLAQIDPAPFQAQLLQAQGTLARDQAQLENARLDLKRYQDAPADTFTPQVVDTQKAQVDQYAGIVKSDEGNVAAAQVNLNYCTITAQVTGRIGLRNVDQGNIVHASDANGLAVITQLQPIAVLFSVGQDDIPKIMKNSVDVPPLEVTALDQNMDLQKVLAKGTLTAIDSEVFAGTNRVRLKGEFKNTDNALFPGDFVNARLLVDTLRNKVIVSSSAVQHGPDNMTFVYVVGADNKADVRNITPGPEFGDSTSIDSGLSAGENVVVDGVDKLQPGMTVRVAQSAATQASGSTRPSGGARGSGRRGGRGGARGATTNPADLGGAGGGARNSQ